MTVLVPSNTLFPANLWQQLLDQGVCHGIPGRQVGVAQVGQEPHGGIPGQVGFAQVGQEQALNLWISA